MKVNIKLTTRKEYEHLLAFLEGEGYRWLSGQSAHNIPTYLTPAWVFREADELICIRSVEFDKKTIGFIPIEIYTANERAQIIKTAIPVEIFIKKYFSLKHF